MDWIATLLPETVSPLLLAALAAASFATSFITAAFGIGGGAVLIAILASLIPPAALIPVHGVVQLGSNAGRMALLLRHVAWGALPWFVLGALVGCGIGGLVAVELPPGLVQAGVGLFVLWTVLLKPPAWLRRWPLVTGAFSSFLTMFFGATGPFVAGWIKSLGLDRHGHVATHAAVMTLQHAIKVAVFGLLGFAFGAWWLVIAAMIGAGLAGTWAGRALLNRMSDQGFRRALDIVLILIALRLIWVGGRAATGI